MIIVTNIYAPNHETKIMQKSFEEMGYEVAVNKAQGNGNVLRALYECYKRATTGHDLFVYSDGADTFIQKKFTKADEKYLEDKIVYSAESNCYPDPTLIKQYPKEYTSLKTRWQFLNGGNYGGNIDLMIQFIEKYGLNKLAANANGQHEQHLAFLKAKNDGFPIELDVECRFFQSTAFDGMNEGRPEDSAFEIMKSGKIKNKLTKTTPNILHGNGRSPMEWIWDNHEWTKALRP